MKTEMKFKGFGLMTCLFLSLIIMAGADYKKVNLAESEKYDSDFR